MNKSGSIDSYTLEEVTFALADCHRTLSAGAYPPDYPYRKRLLNEIDLLRERHSAIKKAAEQKRRRLLTQGKSI